MSTGVRKVARLIGDEISRGPNRKARRFRWRESRRKTFINEDDKRVSTGQKRNLIPWLHPELASKNTPVRWAVEEVK